MHKLFRLAARVALRRSRPSRVDQKRRSFLRVDDLETRAGPNNGMAGVAAGIVGVAAVDPMATLKSIVGEGPFLSRKSNAQPVSTPIAQRPTAPTGGQPRTNTEPPARPLDATSGGSSKQSALQDLSIEIPSEPGDFDLGSASEFSTDVSTASTDASTGTSA